MKRALPSSALFSIAVAIAASCAAPADPDLPRDTAGATEWIVGGERELGEPAVVIVYNRAGGLCTGTLISPRVVLTAKHCVQDPLASGHSPEANFLIGIGDSIRGISETLSVQSIETSPGAYTSGGAGGLGGALVGIDVAVMVLTRGSSTIEPIPVRHAPSAELVGDAATAIGFGQTPSGTTGVKYKTMTTISGITGGVIYTPPTICQGDSGGPLISADREVFGVASFGTGSCGSGINGYNRLDVAYERADGTTETFLDMIDRAVGESGACLNNGPEQCDGFDNDCNDMVDEGCTEIGGACTSGDRCIGNMCEATPAGMICTQPCDPLRPFIGCPIGLHCASIGGCDGRCVPGTPGMGANDQDCTTNTDCMSLNCADPGDGRRRCLTPCQGDAGMCLAGEVCAAVPGSCGGCVPAAIVSGTRGLGEPCTDDAECLEACFHEEGDTYCTRACESDDQCGGGFHCRVVTAGAPGQCVRGRREGVGTSCTTNEDCHDGGFCASRGEVSWCTDFCNDASPCPEGFDCINVGTTPDGTPINLCAPQRLLVGEECTTDDECLSGVCADGDGGARVCSRHCSSDAPCSVGFECRRTEDGTDALCLAPIVPEAPPGEEGCGCTVPGATPASSGGIAVALLALAAALVRKRHKARRR